MKSKCPLCGRQNCSMSSDSDFFLIDCATYGSSVNITRQVVDDFSLTGDIQRVYNLIVERLVAKPTAPDHGLWVFYHAPDEMLISKRSAYVNLAGLLAEYPVSVMDKAGRILLNLSNRYPGYGMDFEITASELRLYFPDNAASSDEAFGAMKILADLGYVRSVSKTQYYISAEGWKAAEEAKRQRLEARQAYIALAAEPKAAPIADALHRAVADSGYTPVAVDEKIHRDKLCPEILFEIQKSRFLVIDVSCPDPGAYYQAGYAQALGKEVIVCCKSSVFSDPAERPKFDISRNSPLLWETERDLVTRLRRRIEATVG